MVRRSVPSVTHQAQGPQKNGAPRGTGAIPYPPTGCPPPRKRRVPRWILFALGVCVVGNLIVIGMALYPKWPSLFPSLPSYKAAPDPCESLSPALISSAFGPNPPRSPDKRDESSSLGEITCEWMPSKDQADALGRYSYLKVEVAVHNTSHGRPDFESVVNDFESVQDSNPGDVHGLGDQAVASHEWDEVTLLACRANLTVKVTYNSVAMVPPHRETPVSPARLDAEARQVVRQVLGAAGDPA